MDLPVSVSVSTLTAILDGLRAMKVDVAPVLAAAGVSPELLADPHARIDRTAVDRAWAQAAVLTGDPHVGLTVARWIAPGALGVYEYLVRNARTLRELVAQADQYMRLVDARARVAIVDDLPGGSCAFRIWREGGIGWSRHDIECVFAAIVAIVRELFPAYPPSAAHLGHAPAEPREAYRRVLGFVPSFGGDRYELWFPAAILDVPVPRADPHLARILAAHASQLLEAVPTDELPGRTRAVLHELLPDATLERAAHRLGVSPRTLRRRLRESGTSFRDLLDDLRAEVARRWVADGRRPLKEVAAGLGFAEQSTFQRAFKRWTGVTPAELRRASR